MNLAILALVIVGIAIIGPRIPTIIVGSRAMAAPAGAFSGTDAVGVFAIGEDGTGAMSYIQIIELPPTTVIEASVALI